jgi:hypothetical protein
LTDSWLLQELAGKIQSADAARRQAALRPVAQNPPYVTVLIGALGEALGALGRNGTEVIDTLLMQRHGLRREDIAYRPGAYMSAMKDILDSGAQVLEKVMLEEIQAQTGITAMTMEDAVFKLKSTYKDQAESTQGVGSMNWSVRANDAGYIR